MGFVEVDLTGTLLYQCIGGDYLNERGFRIEVDGYSFAPLRAPSLPELHRGTSAMTTITFEVASDVQEFDLLITPGFDEPAQRIHVDLDNGVLAAQ